MTVKIVFILPSGERRECVAETGQTLLKLAQDNGFDLEGTCEGGLACATCHVVIDPLWYGKLPPPSQDELDMLDLAPKRARTSRLSCQIKLTEVLDGLLVKVLK
jgi:2Fe-2S ferredoxin